MTTTTTAAAGAAPRPWRLDYDGVDGLRHAGKLDPPGYDAATAREFVAAISTTAGRRRDPKLLERKQAALWQAATGSARQVGFMCFMMWMMGGGVQIFSIIMTLTSLASPAMAIWRSKAAFPPDPEKQLFTLGPRLVFCLIQAGQLLFALHRLNGMGLLPTHASDWLSAVAAPRAVEHAYAPL